MAPSTRVPAGDYALLAVAVVAVSTSAPLVRSADAPTLAIAFWRNALSLPLLGIWLLARRAERRGWRARSARDRRLSRLAGAFLAGHFATWIPSLSFTTVASSVALVATQPVWAALIARQRGEHVHRPTWIGIGLALAGTILLTGVDLSISTRALLGDLLALVGGMLAAAYVTVGGELRQRVSTVSYALACYATASVLLLGLCLVSSQDLRGYDDDTWLAIGAMVIGAQLLGHTLVNLVLRSISPTAVSVAILFEILGATVIARSRSGRRRRQRPGPPRSSSGSEWWSSLRSDQDAEADLVDPGGLLT